MAVIISYLTPASWLEVNRDSSEHTTDLFEFLFVINNSNVSLRLTRLPRVEFNVVPPASEYELPLWNSVVIQLNEIIVIFTIKFNIKWIIHIMLGSQAYGIKAFTTRPIPLL